MMQVMPNTGILGDDRLDKLRGDAIAAQREKPLPTAVVDYLRALESRYASHLHQQRERQLREIGWTLVPKEVDGE